MKGCGTDGFWKATSSLPCIRRYYNTDSVLYWAPCFILPALVGKCWVGTNFMLRMIAATKKIFSPRTSTSYPFWLVVGRCEHFFVAFLLLGMPHACERNVIKRAHISCYTTRSLMHGLKLINRPLQSTGLLGSKGATFPLPHKFESTRGSLTRNNAFFTRVELHIFWAAVWRGDPSS